MSRNKNTFNARKNKKRTKQNNFENNTLWDDLNKLYLECIAVTTTPARVLPLVKNKELLEKIENVKDLKESLTILTKDVVSYSEKLNSIKAKHEGKTGKVVNEDDILFSYSLVSEYQKWLESYQIVVLPNAFKILNMFDEISKENEGV